MNQNEILNHFNRLLDNQNIVEIYPLPPSGSDRKYFRIRTDLEKSFIVVYNKNLEENEAYFSFTYTLIELGIFVPKIIKISKNRMSYILEDLGDMSLLKLLEKERNSKSFKKNSLDHYSQALKDLAYIQTEADKIIDYSKCVASAVFDINSMLSDCHQFKYWFLLPNQIIFRESKLEKDFQNLCNYLYNPEYFCFMYRDFQARNILINDSNNYYIDFQGGRKGPLQYDLASILFQAKAQLSPELRLKLLEEYLDALEKHKKIDRLEFKEKFWGFVLLRTLQVLGAYGFKGYYQKKEHFLQSIPYAIKNLEWLLNQNIIFIELPELREVIIKICKEFQPKQLNNQKENTELKKQQLQLHIRSFSYKKGIPEDVSNGHGQGFVFDCRMIHNPGRYEEYKNLTGLDLDVKNFLKRDGEIDIFLQPVMTILKQTINRYIERNFEYLGINFGCTGGQHRSVYAAEYVADELKKQFGEEVFIKLEHREKPNWANMMK